MLFFVDESFQTIGSQEVGALGAVAIPVPAYNRVCSALYRIKMEEYGATELDSHELKGNRVFSKASFRGHADPLRTYSNLDAAQRFFDLLEGAGACSFAIWTTSTEGMTIRRQHSIQLPRPYIRLLEMFDRHVERSSRRHGRLVMDQIGHREDRASAASIQNFIVRARPRLRERLLQIPNYTHSAVSSGIQAADLVAYLAAQRVQPLTRPELGDWWSRVEALASPGTLVSEET